MTQGSTASEAQPAVCNSAGAPGNVNAPRDRGAGRTHGRSARWRPPARCEAQTHWRVSVVPFGMDRARAIEHAEDACWLLVWPQVEVSFFLRDVTGGVELWMRGPYASRWLAEQVAELLERLGPDVWP